MLKLEEDGRWYLDGQVLLIGDQVEAYIPDAGTWRQGQIAIGSPHIQPQEYCVCFVGGYQPSSVMWPRLDGKNIEQWRFIELHRLSPDTRRRRVESVADDVWRRLQSQHEVMELLTLLEVRVQKTPDDDPQMPLGTAPGKEPL